MLHSSAENRFYRLAQKLPNFHKLNGENTGHNIQIISAALTCSLDPLRFSGLKAPFWWRKAGQTVQKPPLTSHCNVFYEQNCSKSSLFSLFLHHMGTIVLHNFSQSTI